MKDELGGRQKKYEVTSNKVYNDQHWGVRIDGRSFSKFMKNPIFEHPFDKTYSETMINITRELIQEFDFDYGFVQSDEISLYKLPVLRPETQLVFSGKEHKIISLTSSFAASMFARKFTTEKFATFDSRLIVFPSETEQINNLIWRMKDCKRNCIQQRFINQVGAKAAQSVPIKDQLKSLGEVYEKLSSVEKYGTLVFADDLFISDTLTFSELKFIFEKYNEYRLSKIANRQMKKENNYV